MSAMYVAKTLNHKHAILTLTSTCQDIEIKCKSSHKMSNVRRPVSVIFKSFYC